MPRRDLGASLLENVGALAYLAAFMPIRIAEYPQLRLLCWNRTSDAALDEAEAFALYERNWRFVREEELEPHERRLIARLADRHGHGALPVA